MPAKNTGQPAKKLLSVQRNAAHHWVGDGFPVRTLLTYSELGALISPFLLLDYAGPMKFPPTEQRLGVGEHPHRGFETVTIAKGTRFELFMAFRVKSATFNIARFVSVRVC